MRQDSFNMDEADHWKTVIIISVFVLNVAMNSTVISVFAKYSEMRDNPTHMFMFSLSCADLVLGITVLPISATLCSSASIAKEAESYLIVIQFAGLRLCLFASLLSLCFVTVSKMVAITRPLHCDRIFTKTRVYVIIALIWAIGAVLAIVWSRSVLTWNNEGCVSQPSYGSSHLPELTRVMYVAFLFIGLVATTYATVKILLVIFRTHLHTTSQVQSIGGNTVATAGDVSVTLMSIRSGRNVLIMCAVTLLLTIPLMTHAVALTMSRRGTSWPLVAFVTGWIAICNTFVNSLLYLFLFRSVRTKAACMFREVFGKCQNRCQS